jgi:hypothetical protein
MSDAFTPNYHFDLPTIGGSQDTWGNKLNANWTALDGFLHTLTGGTGPTGSFLPSTGGTITGSMVVTGGLDVKGALGCEGGATISTLAVNGAIYFARSQVTDFTITRSFPQRILEWATNVTDVYNESTGDRFWNANTSQMQLSYGGNLTIVGNGFKPGGGSWAATSDERVKRNVRPYDAGLADICELLPIRFEYNGDGGTTDDGVTHYGLSAQKTREVMPELVFEMATPRKDGSVDPLLLPGQLGTQLGPLLLAACNAIRELAERVTQLELTSA